MSEAPSPTDKPAATWPKGDRSRNAWTHDAAAFAALIAANPQLWLCDFKLKYIRLRIDTRDGSFIVSDRDGSSIKPERVMEAAAKSKEKFGPTDPALGAPELDDPCEAGRPRQKIDRPWSDYPIGTIAESTGGGYWTKTERGWKWCVGSTFPTPGGDAWAVRLPLGAEGLRHVLSLLENQSRNDG